MTIVSIGETQQPRRVRLTSFLLGAALLAAACDAPMPEEIEGWDVSDDANVEQLDHGPWQDILDGYLATDEMGVNLVDYEGLAANAADTAKLNAYLEYLQGLDPRDYSRAEQMAYWINFYNALTVKVVLDAYPVETIRDIHEGVVPYTGPWDDVHARVTGEELTLNHMEHGILRPLWQDERIHYAVNCAAYGCPHLLDTALHRRQHGRVARSRGAGLREQFPGRRCRRRRLHRYLQHLRLVRRGLREHRGNGDGASAPVRRG